MLSFGFVISCRNYRNYFMISSLRPTPAFGQVPAPHAVCVCPMAVSPAAIYAYAYMSAQMQVAREERWAAAQAHVRYIAASN